VSGEETRVRMMELHSMSSLTTMMGHPAPVVIGLSTQWYFEGLGHLGLVMDSYHLAPLRGVS